MEVDPTPLDCYPFFKIRQLGLVPASKDPIAGGRARANSGNHWEMWEKVVFGHGLVPLLLLPPVNIRGGGDGGAEEKGGDMVPEGAVSPKVEAGAVLSIHPPVELLLVRREFHRGQEVVLAESEGGKDVNGSPIGPGAPVV